MSVEFDADAGLLRLDQRSFDVLVSLADGVHEGGPELTALRDAGAVVDDTPHPAVADCLNAVNKYVCQLRIDLFDSDGTEKTADGWIDPETAALLLDNADDSRDLVGVPPSLLPGVIARLVRLRPHPRQDAPPLQMTRDVFEGLLGSGEEERRHAADRFAGSRPEADAAAVVESFAADTWRRWTATMMWNTPAGEPDSRTLQVVSTTNGLWLCELAGMNATMWPTNATGVWRELTLMLPDEAEQP